MNPDKRCNFDCVYCEVNREEPSVELRLAVPAMLTELKRALEWFHSGEGGRQPPTAMFQKTC